MLYLLAVALSPVFAQSPGGASFEVASVRPAGVLQRGRPVGMRGGPGTDDPGQINWNYVTLQDLLMRAYDVKDYQISGPAWLSTERYDVAAKVPPSVDAKAFRTMLQNLLAQRFALKLHRESKEIPGYELVVAKNGPRFHESAAAPASRAAASDQPPASGTVLHHGADGILELPESMHGKGHLTVRSMFGTEMRVRGESLAYLVERIAVELHTPVIDKTGLSGTYDYALAYTPEAMIASRAARNAAGDGAAVPASAQEERPDLFAAIQSQLGLKLEAKKFAGEQLVIDAVQKSPVEN